MLINVNLLEPQEGVRLDVAITKNLENVTRGLVIEAIKSGGVTVNGIVVKPSYLLKKNDIVSGCITVIEKIQTVKSENIPLDIYYADSDILVVCKPRGMVTHPGNGHQEGTLLNAVHYHYPSTINLPKGGLIQRLDKDTSGLMVIALSDISYQNLVQLMLERRIKRQYEALVWGRPVEKILIETSIGKHPKDHRMRAVTASGKEAITLVETIAYGKWGAKVLCTLSTGRTHQIRVHLQHIGYPICGDEMYGMRHPPFASPENWHGQALHSKYLTFIHPINGNLLKFEAPLPKGWDVWEKELELIYTT